MWVGGGDATCRPTTVTWRGVFKMTWRAFLFLIASRHLALTTALSLASIKLWNKRACLHRIASKGLAEVISDTCGPRPLYSKRGQLAADYGSLTASAVLEKPYYVIRSMLVLMCYTFAVFLVLFSCPFLCYSLPSSYCILSSHPPPVHFILSSVCYFSLCFCPRFSLPSPLIFCYVSDLSFAYFLHFYFDTIALFILLVPRLSSYFSSCLFCCFVTLVFSPSSSVSSPALPLYFIALIYLLLGLHGICAKRMFSLGRADLVFAQSSLSSPSTVSQRCYDLSEYKAIQTRVCCNKDNKSMFDFNSRNATTGENTPNIVRHNCIRL